MTEFHPVAEIFPMMSDREMLDLVEDIREYGLREPIWLHTDGRIIDGRNRFISCRQLGIEPDVRTFAGADSDLVAFVLSLNLHRRHLSESQRATVAARIANLDEGRPGETAPIGAVSQQQAADMLNVGRRSVQRAREVIDKGGPELAALVDSGAVTVSAAASVANEVRDNIAGLAPDDARDVVKAAVQVKREDRIRPVDRPVLPIRPAVTPPPNAATEIVDRVAKHTATSERERAEWRQSLLAAIGRASTSLASFQNEDIAEHGGDVAIDQLRRLAQTLTDKHAEVTSRIKPSGRPNLRIAK